MTMFARLFLALWLVVAGLGGARAQYADQATWGISVAGTNTITMTVANYDANRTGSVIRFVPANTNTSSATINIDSVGAVTIKKVTALGLAALVGGELVSGQLALLANDGSEFVLLNPAVPAPTVQSCASGLTCDGSSHTYTPSSGTVRVKVRMCGPGGGGGANSTNAGSNGSAATTFGSWSAGAGNGGPVGTGAAGTGGANSTGTGILVKNLAGQRGTTGLGVNNSLGGNGGSSPFWGGAGQGAAGAAGGSATANSGAGGAGAGGGGASGGSGGGGSGGCLEFWQTNPGTQTYAVGTGGAGGAAGVTAGGNGATGDMIIEEFYSFLLKHDLAPANDNSPFGVDLVA